MRLTPDIDVVVLMATALSAKRRPAQLVEIVAAADLLQDFVPAGEKLAEAIHRLSSLGLIDAAEGGFALTQRGQEIVAKQPRKADPEQRMAAVKDSLAAYAAKGEYPAVLLTREQISAAMKQTVGNFLPFGIEEVSRQNMAMMERAMSLFSPFYHPPDGSARVPWLLRATAITASPSGTGKE